MSTAPVSNLASERHFIQRHPVMCYFALTFAVSWTGAFLVAAPKLLHGKPIPRTTGPLMFPAMLLGPSVVGIVLTWALEKRRGLSNLLSRMRQLRFDVRWYMALVIPPALILAILVSLETFVSSAFAPNRFLVGAVFGLIAGFFEEIGWMGYAFDKLRQAKSSLTAAIVLGLLWGLWHLPVIDYLGTATPHGQYWLRYFLAFTAAMTAMRVLIAWVYIGTNSVLMAQVMHACSTGSLVILSPARVNAAQEAIWYALYAGALWAVVAIVAVRFGKSLVMNGKWR